MAVRGPRALLAIAALLAQTVAAAQPASAAGAVGSTQAAPASQPALPKGARGTARLRAAGWGSGDEPAPAPRFEAGVGVSALVARGLWPGLSATAACHLRGPVALVVDGWTGWAAGRAGWSSLYGAAVGVRVGWSRAISPFLQVTAGIAWWRVREEEVPPSTGVAFYPGAAFGVNLTLNKWLAWRVVILQGGPEVAQRGVRLFLRSNMDLVLRFGRPGR